MIYYYTLFNQKVKSDLQIPEAIQIEQTEQIDITIELKEPPKWVMDLVEKGESDFISQQVMWFYLKNLVLYYIENGNHIIIYIESKTISELAVRAYLTGSAMALALIQKHYIPVHGGCVSYKNAGVIISGASGSGKSSVTMALRQQGFQFVSDDISVISQKDGGITVFPSFPQQKICRDGIKQFHLKKEELIYIDEDRDKFAWRFTKGYIYEPLPVMCMIEIIVSREQEQVEWKEITGGKKLSQLTNNIYRGEVYQRMESSPDQIKLFFDAAAKIPMYQIIRPDGKDTLSEVVDCIMKQILQNC